MVSYDFPPLPRPPFPTHFFNEGGCLLPHYPRTCRPEGGLVHVGGLWLPGQRQEEPERQLSEQLLFGSFPLPRAHLSRLPLSSWTASSLEPGGSPLQPGGESSVERAPEDGPAYESHKEETFVLKPQRFEWQKPGQG